MIRTLGDKTPRIADTAWVSEFAYVVGDVDIGEHCSIWPGVTIRGDGEQKIVLGDYVNVQEGAVIHGNGLVIEHHVTVGHSVVVHGDFIGEGSLLGNNCLIAANSVDLSGTDIPDNSFVTGIPGEVKRQVSDEQRANMLNTAHHLAEKKEIFRQSGL